MKPVIGITGNYDEKEKNFTLRKYYIDSILEAGGIPIILPAVSEEAWLEEYLRLCDGLVFSGGGDADPYYFGQPAQAGLGEVNPRRDEFEIKLALKALTSNKAALGICRGCQIMNIAAGGTVIQDLETDLCHDQRAPRDYPIHDIFIESHSRLARIVESTHIRVNSFHHQAVDRAGQNILLCAYAQDGTVEALEGRGGLFYLGVQ
ncbi:MAG TPA: gamma-glutamyl-gamma-aminobutyrate hydrolase family protein, partial [Syntrophomonadaceae bacterium]|nr:gamma-glutamyl-gamma-aminobutyrate hydrolase family protein [Syntrophomonadaceae bacterium]